MRTLALPEFPPALSELPAAEVWQTNTAVLQGPVAARLMAFFQPNKEPVKPRSKDLVALDDALTTYETIAKDFEVMRRAYDGMRRQIDTRGVSEARLAELQRIVTVAEKISVDAGNAFEVVRDRFENWEGRKSYLKKGPGTPEDREDKRNSRLAVTSLWLDLHDDQLTKSIAARQAQQAQQPQQLQQASEGLPRQVVGARGKSELASIAEAPEPSESSVLAPRANPLPGVRPKRRVVAPTSDASTSAPPLVKPPTVGSSRSKFRRQ